MTNRDTNNGSYHWNYEDYCGGPELPRGPKPKNRGLRVFLAVLIAAAAVSIIVFVAVSLTQKPEPAPEPPVSLPAEELPNLPEIDQQQKPGGFEDETEPFAEGELSPKAIYKQCKDFVVGIVNPDAMTEGSGIVLSPDGYIITNAHVVAGGGDYEVVLNNGDSIPALLVGMDQQTDLAVLKLDYSPEGLVAATFGDSDELEVGERVVAIGNPGGLMLASTQTVGYVSAVNRTIETELGYTMTAIQADVAINPGNSGGPLINSYGLVVGITYSKLVEEGFEGIGFSIPINEALPIIDDLLANGKVTGRAMLGVMVVELDEMTAVMNGVPQGLLIKSINEGADIGKKGVLPGDIITAIDGYTITGKTAVSDILADHEPGDTVPVTIFRQDPRGRDRTFEVEVVLQGS